MTKMTSLIAGLVLFAASNAIASPIPVNHFLFNEDIVDTGSQPVSMYQTGMLDFADTAPAAAEGKAAVFNGTGLLRSMSQASIHGDFSVSFWMKTAGTSPQGKTQWYDGQGLVDAETGGVTTDWGLSFMNNRVGFGIGLNDTTITTAQTVNDDQWHLISATWQMSTGTMSLYLDGLLSNSTIATSSINHQRWGQNALAIGGLSTDLYYFTGSIADVRVFGSVLTAAEVADIMNPNAVPEPSSIALLGLAAIAGLAARRRRA